VNTSYIPGMFLSSVEATDTRAEVCG